MTSKNQSAPGALETVRLFVNTVDFEDPASDEFATAAGAASWLRAHGVVDAGLSERDAGELRELRETIRRALLAHGGHGDLATSERALSTALADARAGLRVGAEGYLVLDPCGATVADRVRSALAIAIYNAVVEGVWRRLKACLKDTCRFAFYDHSKNGSGTWCDMAICGNRVKAAKRRAKSRASI
jgi:predicted RNA-binding Zn ribbon-like protein